MQRYRLILAGVVFASSTLALAASASSPTAPASPTGAAAQSAAIDLRGLYVVTKVPPASNALGAAVSAAFNVPGVNGAVLVFGWDVIEPAMGQYDWTAFDQWIDDGRIHREEDRAVDHDRLRRIESHAVVVVPAFA